MRNFKVISEIEPTGRAVFTNSKLGATCGEHFEIINIFITHSVGSKEYKIEGRTALPYDYT